MDSIASTSATTSKTTTTATRLSHLFASSSGESNFSPSFGGLKNSSLSLNNHNHHSHHNPTSGTSRGPPSSSFIRNRAQQNVTFKANASPGGGGSGSLFQTKTINNQEIIYTRNKYNNVGGEASLLRSNNNNNNNAFLEDYQQDGDGGAKYRSSVGRFTKPRKEWQQHHYAGSSQSIMNNYHKASNNQLVMRSMLTDAGYAGEANSKLLTWLDEELDSMGIDPIIYRPYVLSILSHGNDEHRFNHTEGSTLLASNDTGNANYCDLHQRFYPYSSNRLKFSNGLLRLKENVQKPASTTKWMHKRYLQQNGSPTGSNSSINLMGDDDFCPECLNSRNYRRMIVVDTLKAATDEPESVAAFVDELLHRYEKLQQNRSNRELETKPSKTRYEYDERTTRSTPNKHPRTLESKYATRQTMLTNYGEPNCSDEDNDYDDRYHSKSFVSRKPSERRPYRFEEDIEKMDGPQENKTSSAAKKTIHAQAMQYFAAFPSLSATGLETPSQTGSTSGVGSTSGSSISNSMLPSLSSPLSQQIASRQSSIEDCVFGETVPTSSSSETTNATTTTASGEWNGLRLISSVKSVNNLGATLSNTLGAGGGGERNGKVDVTDMKTIGASKTLTGNGKARVVVVGGTTDSTIQPSSLATFTTLKKKVGNNPNTSSSTSSAPITSNLVKSSSILTKTMANLSNEQITTKDQEKIFALLPSFMKATSTISTATTTTLTTSQSMISVSSSSSSSSLSSNMARTYTSWSHWNYKKANKNWITPSRENSPAATGGGWNHLNRQQQRTTRITGGGGDNQADHNNRYGGGSSKTTYGGSNVDVTSRGGEHNHPGGGSATFLHPKTNDRGGGGASSFVNTMATSTMTTAMNRKQQQAPPPSMESLRHLLPSYLKLNCMTPNQPESVTDSIVQSKQTTDRENNEADGYDKKGIEGHLHSQLEHQKTEDAVNIGKKGDDKPTWHFDVEHLTHPWPSNHSKECQQPAAGGEASLLQATLSLANNNHQQQQQSNSENNTVPRPFSRENQHDNLDGLKPNKEEAIKTTTLDDWQIENSQELHNIRYGQTSTTLNKTEWLGMAPTADSINALLHTKQSHKNGEDSSTRWMTTDMDDDDAMAMIMQPTSNVQIEHVSMFWNKHSTLNWMNFNTANNEEIRTKQEDDEELKSEADFEDKFSTWANVPFYHRNEQDTPMVMTTTTTTLLNHESSLSAFLEVSSRKEPQQQQSIVRDIDGCDAGGLSILLKSAAAAPVDNDFVVGGACDSPFQPIQRDDSMHELESLLNDKKMEDCLALLSSSLASGSSDVRVATSGGSFSASRSELEGYLDNRRQMCALMKASLGGSQASSGLSSLLSLHCDSDSSSLSSSVGPSMPAPVRMDNDAGDDHKRISHIDNELAFARSHKEFADFTLDGGGDLEANTMDDVSALSQMFTNISFDVGQQPREAKMNRSNLFDTHNSSSFLNDLLNDVLGVPPASSTSMSHLSEPKVTNTPQELTSLPFSKRHKAKNGFIYGKVESNPEIIVRPKRSSMFNLVRDHHDEDEKMTQLESETLDTEDRVDDVYYGQGYDYDAAGGQDYHYGDGDYEQDDQDDYSNSGMNQEEYSGFIDFLEQRSSTQQQQQRQQQPTDRVSSLFDVLQFKTENRAIDSTIHASKPSQKPCTFFMEGFCARGDCKFSHDLSSITCKYWMEGFCLKADHCPFRHSFEDVNETSNTYGGDNASGSYGAGHSRLDPNAKSFDFSMEDSDFPALTLEEVEQQQETLNNTEKSDNNPLEAMFASTHKEGSCHFSIGTQHKNSKHKNRIKLNDLNALDMLRVVDKRADSGGGGGGKSLSQVIKASNLGSARTMKKQSKETIIVQQTPKDEWPSLASDKLQANKTSRPDFPELPSMENGNTSSITCTTSLEEDASNFRDQVLKNAKTKGGAGKGKRNKYGSGIGKMVTLQGFL